MIDEKSILIAFDLKATILIFKLYCQNTFILLAQRRMGKVSPTPPHCGFKGVYFCVCEYICMHKLCEKGIVSHHSSSSVEKCLLVLFSCWLLPSPTR